MLRICKLFLLLYESVLTFASFMCKLCAVGSSTKSGLKEQADMKMLEIIIKIFFIYSPGAKLGFVPLKNKSEGLCSKLFISSVLTTNNLCKRDKF